MIGGKPIEHWLVIIAAAAYVATRIGLERHWTYRIVNTGIGAAFGAGFGPGLSDWLGWPPMVVLVFVVVFSTVILDVILAVTNDRALMLDMIKKTLKKWLGD